MLYQNLYHTLYHYIYHIPLEFSPEIDALAGQRDSTAPSVGHFTIQTPTEWLQRCKGAPWFQDSRLNQVVLKDVVQLTYSPPI